RNEPALRRGEGWQMSRSKPTRSGVILRGDRNCCPSCGALFNSTYAFDKHRTGSYAEDNRRCMTAAEMQAIGMAKNQMEFWTSAPRFTPQTATLSLVVDA